MKEAEKIVGEIAKKCLRVGTLETRNSDELDFHDLPVWWLKEALMAAYEAGKASKEA